MKNRLDRLVFIMIALGAAACSPYQRLTKDFTGGQNSLTYLYGPNKRLNTPVGPGIKLLNPVISTRFGGGEVKKVSAEVVPLLIFNGWNYKYECVLGRNQIKENIGEFVGSSLKEESNRSGTFRIGGDTTANFSIDIEIDSISSKGPYKNSGFWVYLVIALIRHTEEGAGPGRAFCSYHYTLRKGEQILLNGFVKSEKTIEMLQPKKKSSFKDFHGFYRANLVESLSETIKMNNEKLVRKINQYFKDNPI